MEEIVPVGPSHRPTRPRRQPSFSSRASAQSGNGGGGGGGGGYVVKPFDSEKLPPTLVSEIRPFLRVANLIEAESPRVACLCRFHAFEKAHLMDPLSNGRGVRQFKTGLLRRLEQDWVATTPMRKEKNDARELRSFYERMKALNEHEITTVLLEVLKAVILGIAQESAAGENLEEKYGRYNILPLHLRNSPGGRQQPIMHLLEIKAAVSAVYDVRGLPSVDSEEETTSATDLLEWLQTWFGFQKGNVANQREHLILLLANMQVRLNPKPSVMTKLDDRAVNELLMKVFGNYLGWCKFLRRKSNIWLPSVKQEVQQHKLLYIALYFLIWGEASNLRLMPECLCYIFHNMAYELYGILSGAVSLNTGEKVRPAYGGEPESFLTNVVTPIYKVVYEEAKKNKNGVADHSKWRNYDDINEFFWSVDCFKLGWPMRPNSDFFCTKISSPKTSTSNSETSRNSSTSSQSQENPNQKWLGKTNFVEIRSFWHLFRSFFRMWTFFVLALQVMIIMAWNGLDSPLDLLDPQTFENILSIFITSAGLRLIQVAMDIVFSWKARHTMSYNHKLRYGVKLLAACIWTVVLPTFYNISRNYPVCSAANVIGRLCLSPYMVVVAIYLTTNVLGMALFLVPAVRCYIETSNSSFWKMLSWWCQPRLYVGRGIQEGQVSVLKYTAFWVTLLSSKFLFSYYLEIKPLIGPTKLIMKINVNQYDWHELFPHVKNNLGAILAIWAPIILVYFMDTQIWYSIFCTVFGGMYGIVHHLGEIRTMGMVRSRFHTLPSVFNFSLVPRPSSKERKTSLRAFLENTFCKDSKVERHDIAKFALVWNKIISSFRSEDIISNREMELMTMPLSTNLSSGPVRWPLFLLATKFSTAVDMAAEFKGRPERLYQKILKDNYMFSAVAECYISLKYITNSLVVGKLENSILNAIYAHVEASIENSNLLKDLNFRQLPVLSNKLVHLVQTLFENKEKDRYNVTILLQDIYEIVIKDLVLDSQSIMDAINSSCMAGCERNYDCLFGKYQPELFASTSIRFPLPQDDSLKEQVKRLYLLLTTKEKAMDVPSNLEARRRISFFATSLFMDMPFAPRVRNMLSFSVITPYFMEEVNFSEEELHLIQDGASNDSILTYMQKIYPDEWKNFVERLGKNPKSEEVRYWASFRGQTLSRTVRGMMYYREALKLQAFLDKSEQRVEDIYKGYTAIDQQGQNPKKGQPSLSAQLDALTDMKFTYVISCQKFGEHKANGDPHAQDIIDLMTRYPALRVAYIEEKEVMEDGVPCPVYSSVLIKGENNFDQEIYKIKLPGPPIIGEGKPENQNHAIIFTRGEALQTIDMNQDNYLEEAYKMRNVLQEFVHHSRGHAPTILGLREHIFTGSVSSLAGFMSYQETSFVTIGQRFLANPLRVRFHYGHPDIFDRIFHLTRGGISKASKTINLSEDVFAGYNSTLRRGNVTYKEYIQVGKGRDVGLNQISKFEAKVTNGNSEQALSRDIYRLGRGFDFFRMLSCYFSTVGFYFNSLISIVVVYVFLYGQLYLVLSGLEKALLIKARTKKMKSLETALASQSFLQLGLLTGLPMVMELCLEKGFRAALSDFILMQMQLASVFFTFSLGTKAHYFGRTILHGGAKYRPTGRKFVVFHASFTENYQLYSRSHFVKGFELTFLLIVYNLFRKSYENGVAYLMATYSTWFMALTWLFTPFLFNPMGFAWKKIVEDWADWNCWMKNPGGVGVHPDKSWESWWNAENSHLRHSGLGSKVLEVALSLRFFIYQYGLVYHLNISGDNKTFLVYLLSWLVIIAIIALVKIFYEARRRLSSEHQLVFRFLKLLLFLVVITSLAVLYAVCKLSIMDMVICCLAFIPTGWGLLSIVQVLRPRIELYSIWEPIQAIAHAYDYGMGSLLFAPIAILAWLPVVSAIQTRVLFNQAFNRQLQIQPVLAGRSKYR